MAQILVIDDEPADRHLMRQALEKEGHSVHEAETAADALEQLRSEVPDVVILDILLPDENGLEVFQKIRAIDSAVPVIFVTALGSSHTAIEAVRRGAFDYLVKPLKVNELRELVGRAVKMRQISKRFVSIDPVGEEIDSNEVLIGRSPAMHEVYKSIGLVAAQNVTVLIRGESGTGKELVARAIYQFSHRADKPFLAVNCAAIPESLLESELFGHEKGAFTGAERRRIGKFEQCNGGTLFLDEIGDMPLLLQSKLLRVLQGQPFERVGGNQPIHSDVRVIAATNRDLEAMVAHREFREDLFYRLNGFMIHLPPLRERGDDLILLIEHFRRRANRELGKDIRGISDEAMELLRRYPWPGNVRELQNVIRQAALKATGPVILPEFLPPTVRASAADGVSGLDQAASHTIDLDRLIDERIRSEEHQAYDEVISLVEQRLVQHALRVTGGNRREAVRLLGVNPTALRSPAALELLGLGDGQLQQSQQAPSGNSDTDRATANAPGAAANDEDREPSAREQPASAGGESAGGKAPTIEIHPGMTMEEIEKEAIRQALLQTGGRRTEAAKMLGLSVRTLQRKIKQFGLDL